MVRDDGQLMRLVLVTILVVLAASGCSGMYSASDSGSTDYFRTDESMDGMTTASQSLLRQSRYEQAAGEYAQAAASLERAIRIDQSHPTLWIALGRLRLIEGEYEQAEQVGRKAQSLAAGDSDAESAALQLVVEALRGQGRYEEARQLDYGDS